MSTTATVTSADLGGLLAVLSRVDRNVTDAERVDQLTALERVKAACAAAQVRVTADFAQSQEQVAAAWRQRAQACADGNDFDGWRAAREQERRATVQVEPSDSADHSSAARRRAAHQGSARVGVAGQVALARRESPWRGAGHLSMALALARHLPRTLAALEAGAISEWRAEIVVRETAVLSVEQRSSVDAELFDALGTDGVGQLGDRELQRRLRAICYRVDAASVLARSQGAQGDRRVTIRPAPDTMSYVTAYLPVAQGVAVHAALTQAAMASQAAGDERSKGQVMADTLVEHVTGQASADAVPMEVQVVITDRALLSNVFDMADETPAQVPGYGTVPAAWARDRLRDPGAVSWLRRLYTHPETGDLVAMDSRRRTFNGGLRRFLIARDGTCRTPWCDAPIRELDHVVDHASGGPTDARNGQGQCTRCNHTKQQPGWRSRPDPVAPPGDWRPQRVVITTPTGHTYASAAPPLIPGDPHDTGSVLERHLETLLAAA